MEIGQHLTKLQQNRKVQLSLLTAQTIVYLKMTSTNNVTQKHWAA